MNFLYLSKKEIKGSLVERGSLEYKIFHRVANSNRRNNTVEPLNVNGSVSSDTTEIREHILQFHNLLYIEQFSWWPKLDGLPFDSIGDKEAIWMERPFEEIEVLEVVKMLCADKALGLDGFSFAFY
jgi:hypothetical protein